MNQLKYVMEVLKRREIEERIPVLRLEIDYELVTLYDAMQANDTVEIIKAKERLKFLSGQLQVIQGY